MFGYFGINIVLGALIYNVLYPDTVSLTAIGLNNIVNSNNNDKNLMYHIQPGYFQGHHYTPVTENEIPTLGCS